ncbi:MAG: argininosuccinate lyase [Planctomycetota bacterium]|nr:argininosuccinate lyase [Planctomycetota bacterium]
MTTLYAGRFSGEADPLFRQFNDSLPFDHALASEDIEGSIAWARALMGAGVLTPSEFNSLESALREIEAAAVSDPACFHCAKDEDIHSWVERELVARVGDLGKKLHTGRSRNDQVATDLRLWIRTAIIARQQELDITITSFLALAERERSTVFPGYTHLQRAQPVLFAHWCLAYVEMLLRDRDRLGDAGRRAGQCPLGSGALAGTAYPIDRVAISDELGFDGPTANSLDAVSDRDFVVETIAAISLASIHLSRFAEDLIFYTSTEAGFIELSDDVTSGSSLMPQKKNPDALELIRGKAGRQVGHLVSILMTLKGLPLAYNKDLQEDKEPLFDAMEQLSMSLRMVPRVLDGLRVNRERSRTAAEGGYSNATELADYLVSKGVPFRDAHHVTGRLVRAAIADQKPLEGLSIERLAKEDSRITSDVFVALKVDNAIAKRDVLGGTAANRVKEGIASRLRALAGRRTFELEDGMIEIREASVDDVTGIHSIVEHWARLGEHLPRTADEILERLSDFGVAVRDGRVVGCGSLLIYTPQLAEIRSLGLLPSVHGSGLGRRLVRYFLDWAAELHVPSVFVLTRAPSFFSKCGFRQVSINSLPDKVLKDCARCPRNANCDEVAMVYDIPV